MVAYTLRRLPARTCGIQNLGSPLAVKLPVINSTTLLCINNDARTYNANLSTVEAYRNTMQSKEPCRTQRLPKPSLKNSEYVSRDAVVGIIGDKLSDRGRGAPYGRHVHNHTESRDQREQYFVHARETIAAREKVQEQRIVEKLMKGRRAKAVEFF